MYYQIFLSIHMVLCVALVGLILLQHGKGADIGASFGSGGANTMFGSSGSGNFLVRGTKWLATLFFVSSLGLSYIAVNYGIGGDSVGLPSTQLLPSSGGAESLVPSIDELVVPPSTEQNSSEDFSLIPSVDDFNQSSFDVPSAGEVTGSSTDSQ